MAIPSISEMMASLPNLPLHPTTLLLLAPLLTIPTRTALTGTSSYFDIFVLLPGLHKQQLAPQLSNHEYPAVAALTTGYVFRVENQATVYYLQRVGRTGALTTLDVGRGEGGWNGQAGNLLSAVAYLSCVLLTFATLAFLVLCGDHWGLIVMLNLMFARLLNVLVIRSRARAGWHGQPEPGVKGDLLVLLSQDRWVRLQGAVDDLKAVTSGQWLRDETFFLESVATLLVYTDAALVSGMTESGKWVLFVLLVASTGLLAIANELTVNFCMHDCTVSVKNRRHFGRRLELVETLRQEKDRNVDAMESAFVQMGMVKDVSGKREVTM
jgi:hypothetical protein